jgi:hypothetical protein
MFVLRTDEEVLIRLWRHGVTVREIGNSIGLSPSAICRHASRLGLPRRSRSLTSSDRAAFKAFYAEGLTISEVASRTGFHRDTVRSALVKQGVELRDPTRRWPVRHDAFAPPETAETWYWIGMLAADGCMRGPAISLIQRTSRAALLHRFLEFVGSPGRPFRLINGGAGSVADVSSPRLAADLARHGVVPRKSLTMQTSPDAAAEPMFWLGVFDGDGCCTISKAGIPTIGIVGARPLMTQFADFLHALFGDHRPAVGSVGKAEGTLSDVRVSGDRARRLAEHWLSLTDVSLEGKRERLRQAAQYSSNITRARLAVRRRPCDWCGALVVRMPSQFLNHVFCTRAHYRAWKRSGGVSRGGRPVADG